ncbi:MAG: hypothetical protein KJT03_14695, partial [Verrucomicrobiae bacterium]|nr:hypothetical protein [Verrucomicrobiae bacterium]
MLSVVKFSEAEFLINKEYRAETAIAVPCHHVSSQLSRAKSEAFARRLAKRFEEQGDDTNTTLMPTTETHQQRW